MNGKLMERYREESLGVKEFVVEADSGDQVYVDLELQGVEYSYREARIRYDEGDHPEELEYDYSICNCKLSGFNIDAMDLIEFIDEDALFEVVIELLRESANSRYGED